MHERVDGIKSGFNFGKKFAFKGFLAFVLLTVKERKIEEGGHRGMKEWGGVYNNRQALELRQLLSRRENWKCFS